MAEILLTGLPCCQSLVMPNGIRMMITEPNGNKKDPAKSLIILAVFKLLPGTCNALICKCSTATKMPAEMLAMNKIAQIFLLPPCRHRRPTKRTTIRPTTQLRDIINEAKKTMIAFNTPGFQPNPSHVSGATAHR